MTASLLLCADAGASATAIARIDEPRLIVDAIIHAVAEARRKAETAQSEHLRAIYRHSAEALHLQLRELLPGL